MSDFFAGDFAIYLLAFMSPVKILTPASLDARVRRYGYYQLSFTLYWVCLLDNRYTNEIIMHESWTVVIRISGAHIWREHLSDPVRAEEAPHREDRASRKTKESPKFSGRVEFVNNFHWKWNRVQVKFVCTIIHLSLSFFSSERF